jgi:hypothetical protein
MLTCKPLACSSYGRPGADSLCTLAIDSFRESRMRETRPSGLTRGEAVAFGDPSPTLLPLSVLILPFDPASPSVLHRTPFHGAPR